jgi:hypothetical protein
MLGHVALVSTDVSEELSASIIMVTTPMIEAVRSTETSVLIRATRRNTSQNTPFFMGFIN